MGSQFNIRSEKARALAIELSKDLEQPLAKIVEDALEAYRAIHPRRISRKELLWGSLLKEAQAEVRERGGTFEIDDLYDPETGLPA